MTVPVYDYVLMTEPLTAEQRASIGWSGRQGLGDLAPGDLVAVPGTGAYCRSMASNYNHLLRPPVVAVRDGMATVVVRRETEDDLLRTDVGAAMGGEQ